MDFSYIALNRIVEESKKRTVKRKIKNEEKIVLSTGRKRNDSQLIEKLSSFQIYLTREKLGELCGKFLSSEEMTNWITKKYSSNIEDYLQNDWTWICLTVLWERWYGHIPNVEMLDDKMQLGYHLRYDEKKYTEACDVWLGAWRDVVYLTEKGKFRSIDEFDDRVRGTQSLHNWCQDFEMELANGGVDDKKYYGERIKYCEEFINLFPHEDQLVIGNMQRAIAESYFELGQGKKSNVLYQQYLKKDPRWGWGWIGWSDCYWFYTGYEKEYERAESILKEGLKVKGLRDREDVLARLEGLYEEAGRTEDAEKIRKKLEKNRKNKSAANTSVPGANSKEAFLSIKSRSHKVKSSHKVKNEHGVMKMKVGRNAPCPCGSGKKYKYCCGR